MKTNLQQKGFTLVEMVAVIVILAVLAANAMPRFISMTKEARAASVQGVAGGLRTAIGLAQSKWFVDQSANEDTVNMNGTLVSVVAATNAVSTSVGLGTPLVGSTGIDLALDPPSGFTSAQLPAGLQAEQWWPTGVAASASCYIQMQSGTVTTVATDCS